MFPATTEKVERNTSPAVQAQFDQRLVRNIALYSAADSDSIQRRLGELDREWNVARVIELEAPVTILAGLALGVLSDRKWFALSALAASMVILHNLQGWYPLLPVLRRAGFRTQGEIEQERMALRALLEQADSGQRQLH
jgi:hypothetical protein